MTKLDEIEARLNAATPGPWETLEGDTAVCQRDDPYAMIVTEVWQSDANTAFIAHAPADIARLLEIARKAREFVRAWHERDIDSNKNNNSRYKAAMDALIEDAAL